MKSFIFAIIRLSLVILIGIAISSVMAFLMYSGKLPSSINEVREMLKESKEIRETRRQMVSRSWDEAAKIKDDFNDTVETHTPTKRSTSDTVVIAIDNSNQNGVSNEKIDADYGRAIRELRNQLSSQQKQLDRIENQNRLLTLQMNEFIKNGRPQTH